MKKNYQNPETLVVKVEIESMVASTNLDKVDGNAITTYGGGSSQAARVKQSNYDVWGEDWNGQ